jgi:circadian clock protein KaiC
MAIERCDTGIPELDQILRGGIPRRNIVLLAGGSGMGKTTLALEFLTHGAEKGEAGLFLSVTEPIEMLDRNAREYRFVDGRHLDDKTIRLVDLRAMLRRMGLEAAHEHTFDDNDRLVAALAGIVQEYQIKRLVVDSITAICQRLPDRGKMRDLIFKIGLALADLDCTTLLTSETPPRELRYSMFGVEEFIADGIIFLSEMERRGDLVRTLQVMKMRGTEHSRALFMMDLSEYGVSLAPLLRERGNEDG